MEKNNRKCKRCGDCCRKGGPVLHKEDLPLLQEKHITIDNLITIRKGEPAVLPPHDEMLLTTDELIKISGSSGAWLCSYFDSDGDNCKIYEYRPQECRLLECWDTNALEKVIGKDTINRQDLIDQSSPFYKMIRLHEEEVPYDSLIEPLSAMITGVQDHEILVRLTELVRRDLDFRGRVLARIELSPAAEFFIFGRPLFTILSGFGIVAYEQDNAVHLKWQPATDGPPEHAA